MLTGCTPVQMWVLARHGTRYPGKEMIPTLLNLTNVRDEIIKNHERGGELLGKNLLNQIGSSKITFSFDSKTYECQKNNQNLREKNSLLKFLQRRRNVLSLFPVNVL